MTDKIKASAIVGTALLLMSVGTVFAEELQVVGNGADSDNSITVLENSSTMVMQSNTAMISNEVVTEGNTGGNTASGNTGGDTNITTGGVDSAVDIVNKANENVAAVDTCCETGGTDVLIKGNGEDSTNKVEVTDTSCTGVVQGNTAVIENGVEVVGNTGGNEANGATGEVGGTSDPSVTTGSVDATVTVKNVANENVASVTGCCEEAGTDSVTIKGNGVDSTNKVKLSSKSSKFLSQLNFALIGNYVGTGGNTGDNTASGNTGGDVKIKTGSVSAWVSILTKVNKNYSF